MASWKIAVDPVDESKIEYTSLLQSRKFYAVDDSPSTAGSISRQEKAFVDAFQSNYSHPADSISLWGCICNAPTRDFDSLKWKSDNGGTIPSTILKTSSAVEAIRGSDVWFLLTDGECHGSDVHRLAELAQEQEVLNVPLIFVITGYPKKTPSTTDISVGVSFFASSQDTLILFKEMPTGIIYVIAGKGCFAALGGSVQNLESWSDLPVFANEAALFEHLQKAEIYVMQASTRPKPRKGVNLGQEWEEREHGPVLVDLDLLPQAGFLSLQDLSSLLAEEAFDTLAVAYKTRMRIPELRSFILKQRVEQVVPKLEDIAGAAAILSKMADANVTDAEKKTLQDELRAAHTRNREHYQKRVTGFSDSPEDRDIKRRNLLVDAALRSLSSIEATGFSAEIIARKSNRARRAEAVTSVPAAEMASLDLDAPSFKGFCLVCCGEDEVMSICFKKPQDEHVEDNTTDFALNFPLAAGTSAKNYDLVSSQNVCFQCASLAPDSRSIYKEKLTAVIPALEYSGSNKKYINDQLYLALTARLATGAAGIAQLFMAILHNILKVKPWAGAGMGTTIADEKDEAYQRRDTFQWMLDQVIQNTHTREDFKETGKWVKYPEALKWALQDFKKNNLASFIVTYPIAGFNTLLSLGKSIGAFKDDHISEIKSSKAVHSVAAKYLAELLLALQKKGMDGSEFDEHWQQKYLETIYVDFNGPLIPRDHGTNSLVTDVPTFMARLSKCINIADLDPTAPTMHKMQILIFWLIHTLTNHCTAQNFFKNLYEAQPLATAVLNPTLPVPHSALQTVLLSIFVFQDSTPINPSALAAHNIPVPFANPFGPSILHCGAPTCSHRFTPLTSPTQITPQALSALKAARTTHLITIYGLASRFEASPTGLPERPAKRSTPPSSIHYNQHILIARQWASHTPSERHAIMSSTPAKRAFIAAVRHRACLEGRGNVACADMDANTASVLDSFFVVLRRAMDLLGRKDEGVEMYEHVFAENRGEWKVRWELEAGGVGEMRGVKSVADGGLDEDNKDDEDWVMT